MMLALVVAATALAPVERLYLSYGHRANSFSAAFDPDLERHVTDQGFVAFARHECTRTSLAFFDPVGGEIETVLDSFINQERRRGRVAFWKVSTATARYLCERHGFAAAPYGTEHALDLSGDMLRGPKRRNLRRDVTNARKAGARVEVVVAYDASLTTCERRWLAARPQSREIRRATRRCRAAPEPYCTKVRAVDDTGATLGWAAFDHCYRDGVLIGAGFSTVRCCVEIKFYSAFVLNHRVVLHAIDTTPARWRGDAGPSPLDRAKTAASLPRKDLVKNCRVHPTHWLISTQVRWDPDAPKGLPALLAIEGAALVAQDSDTSSDTFRLELGEAPLAPLPRHLAEDFNGLPFVSAVTRLVYDRGRLLYNARGISAWKRKWRAEESALWICCERDPPVFETVAALALIYDP